MVAAMDQEAVEGAIDQEAFEGALDGTIDGSGSSRRRKKSKERWMVPPMDQEAFEGPIDGTNDGS